MYTNKSRCIFSRIRVHSCSFVENSRAIAKGSAMAFVEINPDYRDALARDGLSDPDSFLRLPGVVISGHPDRNVARVTIGSALSAFLKREHRVRWRERFANACAGFGLASRSWREAQTLRALRRTGIGCPEWLAVGEDDRSRAFLLLAEIGDAVDLPQFLASPAGREPGLRSALARRLGVALARMHAAGFDHPDLYSKHVLVRTSDLSVYFLDWQRTRRPRYLSGRMRWRDLAALDATLTDSLATPRERLLCLRTYLVGFTPARRASEGHDLPLAGASGWCGKEIARAIRRQANELLRKRHVREVRSCPQLLGTRGVLWLDGEALCVTQDFWEELDGRIPDWLCLDGGPGPGPTSRRVRLPGGKEGLLVHARRSQPLRWLWAEFRGRPLVSAEVRQAGKLFQAQRQGQPAPRLLAFGQRRQLPWRTESFLLTHAPTAADGGRGA
jgi:tRNA A-37 threonylcarbamoyl transferase component Bud32